MGQLRRRRWWPFWLGLGALGVGLVAAFGWLLWRGPAWVYRSAWPRLTAAEQVTATGQFRIALIQVAGAAGAVVALAYTARTYRLAHRGQLTERFSKALERLGSDEPYVRLGGVHALAHLLRDSADHHQDVVEVLVAFVRQRTPRAASRTGVTANGADTRAGVLLVTSDQALPAEPAPDVQAALTALGRRPRRRESWGMLNLRDLHLAGAVLEGANLTGAWLQGADLTGARLDLATLTDARLEGADLTGAELYSATLTLARLGGATLTDAEFRGATLTDAQLGGATLIDTRLGGATLTDADLYGANLTGVRLDLATLTGAQLSNATLTDAWLYGADLTGAPLYGADLTGARLYGADLTGTRGLTQAQVTAALGDAATRLPAGLERPAEWAAEQEAVAEAAPAGRGAAPTGPGSDAAPAVGDPLAPPTDHP
jgi:uncharacterized protein YjbI with pentapeptide repeats